MTVSRKTIYMDGDTARDVGRLAGYLGAATNAEVLRYLIRFFVGHASVKLDGKVHRQSELPYKGGK